MTNEDGRTFADCQNGKLDVNTRTTRENDITWRTLAVDILVITALWGIGLVIVNPYGEFPLNDDWSFGLAVKQLIEKGEFRPTGWTSMPLITQTFWGALFCMPSGFSFNALRLSTLALSLPGILGTYFLIIEFRNSRCLAIIAALTLCFSPIYFALSNTFMTDVPFAAMTVLVATCFVRCLRNDSDPALIAGTALAIAATLTRQLAIALPMGFAFSFIMIRGPKLRNVVRAVTPPGLCIVVLLAFQQWLSTTGRLPILYHDFNDKMLLALSNPGTLWVFVENAYVACSYLGLFLLPVLLIVSEGILAADRKRAIRLFVYVTGLLVTVLAAIASISGKEAVLLPVDSPLGIGNIITKTGIGPLTLPGVDIFSIPDLPAGFWLAVTGASFLGAAMLISVFSLITANLVSKIRSASLGDNEVAAVFLLLCTLIYLLPLLMAGFYDRYLLPLIPLLAAAGTSVFSDTPRTIRKAILCSAATVILGLSFFAVCSTKDYLEWNRVRWRALHDLMTSRSVKAENIDGGFEFNGWYLYTPMYREDPDKSWWWVQDDSYKISFGRIPGYRVVEEYTFVHWLAPYSGRIVVQERVGRDTPVR
jgi:4-amino-4-deoxy-L-arabinose transferase-like glycosyltransferase